MECIICKDSGEEPIQDNNSCCCKYKCHSSCWIDYVHSRDKLICPLCRKELSNKQPLKTNLTPLRQSNSVQPPYTSQLHTIDHESGQQITYQEFVDTINNHNLRYNTTIEIRQPSRINSSDEKFKKLFKKVIILGIIVFVVVLICLFA